MILGKRYRVGISSLSQVSQILKFYFIRLEDFLIWTIFKVFIELVSILLLFFMICVFFGLKACGILVPRPGIKSTSLALENEVLNTRLPGKSLKS